MSKKIRDSLFIVFIVLFVVITVLISLYAAGYKLNSQWPPRIGQLVQKTGMLILDSNPKGAKIIINGEEQKQYWLIDVGRSNITTPTKIKNLLAGEYIIRLEKEGYWPLEKKIKIESGQSTFMEEAILFKRSLPLNLALCAPQNLSFSPDKKTIILGQDGQIINLKNASTSTITNSQGTHIQWSKDGSQVLLGGKLINLDNGGSSYDLSVIGKTATNFYWDEANKKIYYQANGGINCIITDKNSVSTVLSGGDYAAYAIKNNLIYTIENVEGQNYLRIYDLDNKFLKSSSYLGNGDFHFRQDEYHLNLYDSKQQALYLLSDYAEQAIISKIRPVNNWQWLNNDFLIWHNDFEIYSLNTVNNKQELIIRVSDPIVDIAWHKIKNYLVYANSQQINLINLNLDKKEPIVLLRANDVNNLVLDEKNQLLYFYARLGQQSGIYKLQLQ
ncbi:PEGA domain-containing protein [Patescibacteria group bacterium]|nr:PEGA domain-containing protein [Patescibacteria group bacterium]